MRDIDYWKRKGFAFQERFPNEYDLWMNLKTLQKLRRYVDGQEWLSDLATGKYTLVSLEIRSVTDLSRREKERENE